jgi:hypothetical protein
MNNEDLLVKNKFINKINDTILAENKVKEFSNFYENKTQNLKNQNIIDRANQQFRVSDGLSASKSNKFTGTFREAPVNYMNNKSEEVIFFDKPNVISIDSADRDKNSFPLPNDFTWTFEQEYKNVKQIELISTEIPNSDQTIKNFPPELANNTLSWINEEDYDLNIFHNVFINTTVLDTIDITFTNNYALNSTINILIFNSKLDSDGSITGIIDSRYQATVISNTLLRINRVNGISDSGTCSIDFGYPVYQVYFTPGNYNGNTLVTLMQKALNQVKRRNGNGQYHYFNVSFVLDTNIITIESVITKQLINNPISTIANSNTITVTSLNHGFKTGDTVLMIGVLNTAGISGNILNGNFIVNVIDFNTFTYEVNTSANSTVSAGGANVLTGTPAPFKILFQTENTIIQYTIGYNNEDSSEYIRAVNPITTKTLQITNANLTTDLMGLSAITFTTNIDHGLYACNSIFITSISTGNPCVITTSTPHKIELPQMISIINTNTVPRLNGDFIAIPIGTTAFIIKEKTVKIAGNTGLLFYGGDRIQIQNLRTIPSLAEIPNFYVINTPSVNEFNILFNATEIENETITDTIINTEQIMVNHPLHGFNNVKSITPIDSTFTSIETLIPSNLVGSLTNGVNVIDGPIGSNTVDVLLPSHGLITSDIIRIKDSNTDPIVDGDYNVNVISADELRINFVHSTFVSGTSTIITGDKINITGSNSLPKIDGTYFINNKALIVDIGLGLNCEITTNTVTNWMVGDTIRITNSNSTPDIDTLGIDYFVIQSITGNILTINNIFPIVSGGNNGIIINTSRLVIQTDLLITSNGTNGSLQRNQNVILYRIESDTLNGNSIGGIPLNSINGISFPIISIVDENNYIIRLDNAYATKTITGGGSGVYVSSLTSGWRSSQANTTSGSNSDGTLLARAINLSGESYILLVSPTLNGNSTFKVSSPVKDVLAKILLIDSPGLMNYQGFITSPSFFDPPINKLTSMQFKIVNRDNYPFNFKDLNYSFSLRIIEEHRQLIRANENTRTM